MEQPLSTTINMDLGSAKTTFPLIANDVYARWRVAKVSADWKDLDGKPVNGVTENGKGKVLKVEFDLEEPVPDTEGKQILPKGVGSKFFKSVNLYSKSDAKDAEWFVKQIAELIDALLGTQGPDGKTTTDGTPVKPARPALNLGAPDFEQQLGAIITGQLLVAKMKVKTGEYTGNEFAKVYFPGDLTA